MSRSQLQTGVITYSIYKGVRKYLTHLLFSLTKEENNKDYDHCEKHFVPELSQTAPDPQVENTLPSATTHTDRWSHISYRQVKWHSEVHLSLRTEHAITIFCNLLEETVDMSQQGAPFAQCSWCTDQTIRLWLYKPHTQTHDFIIYLLAEMKGIQRRTRMPIST